MPTVQRLGSRLGKVLVSILVLLWSIYGVINGFAESHVNQSVTQVMSLAGVTFDLEVPQTPEAYKLGLMHRAKLPEHGGMLFRFTPPQVVHFWMKECLMPLDIVFLRDGAIQKIQASAPPCRESPCPVYSSDSPVDMVIELKAGTAQKLGLQVKRHGESK
ncbi:MAG: DUF192 domain-containing protein [Cyanobacteria bacterium]|nr:DUF192 domain-containing protein [Cyanobacteriota bacterium]